MTSATSAKYRFILGCLLLLVSAFVALAQLPAYRFPIATVPYIGNAAPTIDGEIRPGEYAGMAAITGMVSWGTADGSLKTICPRIQQVTWYLGYDDKKLYIAMHSPNPPGIWPIARVKKNDDNYNILWDDHVEIQIAKNRDTATLNGIGFYKIMANAKSAVADEWYYNGTPGTESSWPLMGQVKSGVTRDYWDMEISADIRAFDMKTLDGASLVLQLLRADAPGGIYFAGWVGEGWMSWESFGQVNFSREAPVVRFLDTGDLTAGNMKLKFEVLGQSTQVVPVTLNVTITDANDTVIFTQTKTEDALKGAVKTVEMDRTLPLTDRGNKFTILATCPSAAGGQQVLYQFQAPIIKLTQDFFNKHIGPWLEQRPKSEFDWSFAFWPSYGVAESRVDVDFFGIDEKVAQASAFEVTVTKKGDNKVLSSAKGQITDKSGKTMVPNLKLPAGNYSANVTVYGADGKTVVGKRDMDFVRNTYTWEGNTLGVSNKVIPPFTPIKANDKTFQVWGRSYTVGSNGLLSSIVAAGGAGSEEILTAPITFSALEKGRPVEVTGAKVTVGKSDPGHIDFSSSGKLGAARYKLNSYLEYDGWYNVKLTLDPGKTPTEFSDLTLDVPLWKAADTIYMQRSGDYRRGNKMGALPAGTGRVWSSAELFPMANWKTFCPIAFIGTGDKGLWWFADDSRSWTLSDSKPAIEVFRDDTGIKLQFHIFAASTKLTQPRTIEFAFLIDPVKQMPDERKWGWGRLAYAHDTFGYRYYGGSVDGYENTDADIDALRTFMTDPLWKPTIPVKDPSWLNSDNYFRNVTYNAFKNNEKLVLYGSTALTGLGLPEFDSYGGEWLGRTNWTPLAQTEYQDWTNMQNSKTWTTPRDLSTVGVNFDRSYEDCFTWYHKRLLEKLPFNGTWWDNESISVIHDYDPQTKSFYDHFNVFTRRRLTKRLNNIGWELGREPWWVNNMHVDWSFNQVSWHIENDFYTVNADEAMSDHLTVDDFRAMCRIKRGIIHRLATRGPEGTPEQQRRVGRSAVGMCLLHDIGSYTWGVDKKFANDMLNALDSTVGFFDNAEFVPYWRDSELIKLSTPGVYASIYRGKGKAVLVVLNEKRQALDTPFTLGKDLLNGKAITRAFDSETGEAINLDAAGSGMLSLLQSGVRLITVE